MRSWLAALLMTAAAATAQAEPWSAPDTRLTFEAPAGWSINRGAVQGRTYVVASDTTRQCHLMTVARPATEASPPIDVRTVGAQPLAPAVWEALPRALPRVFGQGAALQETHVDQQGFWPIQFGRYQSQDRVVHAAVQFRPGMEFWSFCYATQLGESDLATFEALHRSVAASDDAQLRADIEAFEARQRENDQRHLESLAEQRRMFETLNSYHRAGGPGPSPGGAGTAGGGGGGGN